MRQDTAPGQQPPSATFAAPYLSYFIFPARNDDKKSSAATMMATIEGRSARVTPCEAVRTSKTGPSGTRPLTNTQTIAARASPTATHLLRILGDLAADWLVMRLSARKSEVLRLHHPRAIRQSQLSHQARLCLLALRRMSAVPSSTARFWVGSSATRPHIAMSPGRNEVSLSAYWCGRTRQTVECLS